MKSDGLKKSYKEFITKYFSNSSGVDTLYNALIDGGDYTKPIKSFYSTYVCDLSWAKNGSYCKSSEVPVNPSPPSGGGNPPSNENTESNGIYTTKGDPYQYKVVGCVWYTKGKKITNWKSLGGNQRAIDILDGRFPNARKDCKKTNVENKPENKDVVVGVGEQTGQTKSDSTISNQGLTSQDIVSMNVEDIDKLLNPTQETVTQTNTSNQQESVNTNTNIIKEDFYNTLKKIS